jgi:hypothetical protein
MSRFSWRFGAGVFMILSIAARPGVGQVTTISARYYGGGMVRMVVTGSIQINDSVAINQPASFSDGEMTWLQYGASGAATPNLLITYNESGYGIGVGLGKKIATAEPQHCTGSTQVKPDVITGEYRCKGVTSYDAGTGRMGNVDIHVIFTATTKP